MRVATGPDIGGIADVPAGSVGMNTLRAETS